MPKRLESWGYSRGTNNVVNLDVANDDNRANYTELKQIHKKRPHYEFVSCNVLEALATWARRINPISKA